MISSLDRISVDNKEYTIDQIDSLPNEFLQNYYPPPIRKSEMTYFDKCKTKAERFHMVGPSLQRTVKGLAFCSAARFLSNFYLCEIRYRGGVL